MGHRMSTLPLDPSLARAVIEAERLVCPSLDFFSVFLNPS